MIQTYDDINPGIAFAKSIYGIKGILIIIGDKMGVWGEVNLVQP